MEIEFTPEGDWSEYKPDSDMEMWEIEAEIDADYEQMHGQMDFLGRTIIHH